MVHVYLKHLANDAAYIGVNAAGQHVWWNSCIHCGESYGYHDRNVTQEDWRLSGNAGTYAQYKAARAKTGEDRGQEALLQTTQPAGMFTLSRKSEAKISPAYQSAVNFALNDNLLDEALLGNDYTAGLTFGQLKSLAVRLVKELTGKDVSAQTIGLPEALGGKAPQDCAAVTCHQMAAVFYRALRFILLREIRLAKLRPVLALQGPAFHNGTGLL